MVVRLNPPIQNHIAAEIVACKGMEIAHIEA